MYNNIFTKTCKVMLLMLLLCTVQSQAQDVNIRTATDWQTFADALATGNSYDGCTVKLFTDLNVSSMVGDTDHPFKGTLDGQQHTVTLSLEADSDFVGLFASVDGASFKDLKLRGTVKSAARYAAALAGKTWGKVTISNLDNRVNIASTFEGEGLNGGFVGLAVGFLSVNNSVYSGTISGAKTSKCGGFIGGKTSNTTVSIKGSLFKGAFELRSDSACATFAVGGVSSMARSYYINKVSAEEGCQGKQAFVLPPEGIGYHAIIAVDHNTYYTAWDTEADADGKYDEQYDRPTYYPSWYQPNDYPNVMLMLCELQEGNVKVDNYELAVFDQDGNLRHCARTVADDNGRCVLTIIGTEGQTLHFRAIYGDDFANPKVCDFTDSLVAFSSNKVVGDAAAPYILTIPGRYILSDTAATLPAARDGIDVRVEREIEGGVWNTICLPFAMTLPQMKAAFGDSVKLCDFIGCISEKEADGETAKTIAANFKEVTELAANHPYIIKVENTLTQFDVDSIDLRPAADLTVQESWTEGTGRGKTTLYNKFIGNYTKDFVLPEYSLYLTGGKFVYANGSDVLKPFRAYFDFNDYLTDPDASQENITIVYEPSRVSGIEAVKAESNIYYDLQGRRLPAKPAVKGIYIKNGKKIVVK